MNQKDVWDELRTLSKGKTIDALIPPFIYVILNGFFTIQIGFAGAILTATLIGIYRFKNKTTLKYAFLGLLGVIFAASLALLSKNASNFYLPKLLTSIGLSITALVSLIVKKPMAAWLSHLSRGWEFNWYFRNDIRPAYSEVTFIWFLLFTLRGSLQYVLLIREDLTGLFIINTLLGTPLTVAVLMISYVYGIWRLKKLKGPSIDEFRVGTPKPWVGQTKGF